MASIYSNNKIITENVIFSIDNPDQDGRTALMYAKLPEVIRILTGTGANVNAQDNEGSTALHIAISDARDHEGQLIINELIYRGANPNIVNKDGETSKMLVQKRLI